MFIKKLSHLHKLAKHRRGTCFAVLGYPRSGTTMLSELVAMVTDYYFDRDNTFPSSSKVVLHSHWDPCNFTASRSLYIIRHPVDVAMSVLDYGTVRSLAVNENNALSARAICSMSWLNHVKAARAGGHILVPYVGLVEGKSAVLEAVGHHLEVPSAWIKTSMNLLVAKHANLPHASDQPFKARKDARDNLVMTERRSTLATALSSEIALHDRLASTF